MVESCITFSWVWKTSKRNEGLPSVILRTALIAFWRPPRFSTFSDHVNVWAMLVKPFLYTRPSTADFTFAVS